jgi:hypothetical protein
MYMYVCMYVYVCVCVCAQAHRGHVLHLRCVQKQLHVSYTQHKLSFAMCMMPITASAPETRFRCFISDFNLL